MYVNSITLSGKDIPRKLDFESHKQNNREQDEQEDRCR